MRYTLKPSSSSHFCVASLLLITICVFNWQTSAQGSEILLESPYGGLSSFIQEKDKDQKSDRIKKLESDIDLAQEHYKKEEFQECAKLIDGSIDQILEIAKAAEKNEIADLKRQIKRAKKAVSLLKKKGQEIRKFPTLRIKRKKKSAPKPAPDSENKNPEPQMKPEAISFSQQIAPILSRRCGNCHIRRASGGVRFQQFAQLENQIDIGDAESSNLYDVISSEQMPPGNNKVPAAEKELIKKWINQGAKFDGKDLKNDISKTAELGSVAALDSSGLTKKRLVEAEKTWNLALPGQRYSVHQTKSFQIITSNSVSKSKWEPFVSNLESEFTKVKKSVGKIPSSNQFSSAKPVLLFVSNYYDFTEFNRIVIKKPLNQQAKYLVGTVSSGPYLIFRSVPDQQWSDVYLNPLAAKLAISSLQSSSPSWLIDSLGYALSTKKKSKKNQNPIPVITAEDIQRQALRSWQSGTLNPGKKEKIDRAVGMGWIAYPKQRRKILKQLAAGDFSTGTVETTFKAKLDAVIQNLAQTGLKKQKRR